jgi:hypothetical protein
MVTEKILFPVFTTIDLKLRYEYEYIEEMRKNSYFVLMENTYFLFGAHVK